MAYADVILAEASLQSYWRLGDAAGSATVVDDKGSIDGTVERPADVTLGARSLLAGDSDSCVFYSPTTGVGRITFGVVYPFTGTASFSAEAWIRPTAAALAGNGMILDNESAIDGWAFRILSTGGIRMTRRDVTSFDQANGPAGTIVADTRYHVVGTYDGATILVYVNGAQVATVGSTRSMGIHAGNLNLGEQQGGGNELEGYIDEVAIYNDDLPAASVLAHYQEGTYAGLRFDVSKFPKAMLRPPVPVRY